MDIAPRVPKARTNHNVPHSVISGVRFWLGTHEPQWLKRTSVDLFISDVRLRERRALPRAVGAWALDSGAFSEIAAYGQWRDPHALQSYAARIERYAAEIGNLAWCAPQDWMCEPFILRKTGLSVPIHQERSALNYLELRQRTPLVIPVLQGYTTVDYLHCIDLYIKLGIDLFHAPLVGVGSVCRRQGTDEIRAVLLAISRALPGVPLHGFGVKLRGLARYADLLASADSMAWSFDARRQAPLPDHTHKNCANCLEYALGWRKRVTS